MTEKKILRCAVYTRKSTEDGLEQDFNSLHAQREACEAFIRSQRSEGWTLIPALYDDGGISGGTMERPALKRLMADVDDQRVDVIVVYKVDRLTRSLADFSKMVELFDRRGVSFVAVTQQFNTTTSMGRLTLNVLLSFAQFEREVTGERIRDKIAASKKKGMWMGGQRPRGYRIENRKLIVDSSEADTVRDIYTRYLRSTGLRDLALELQRDGVTAMRGFEEDPRKPAISRGSLYCILRNPLYAGLVSHKGKVYPGLHNAIVDRATWDQVQEKLKAGQQYNGEQRRNGLSPLKGKLFDDRQRLLVPTYASKNGVRYRYYTSHVDHVDHDSLTGNEAIHWRLPAKEIEGRVTEIVRTVLADQGEIYAAAQAASVSNQGLEKLLEIVAGPTSSNCLMWVERVSLHPDRLSVTIQLPAENIVRIERTFDISMKRRGRERRIVIAARREDVGKPDLRVLKALRLGSRYWQQQLSSEPISALEFATKNGVDNAYIGRAVGLVFLAPDIVENLITGKFQAGPTAERLLRRDALPACWSAQYDSLIVS